jgi:ribosomal protein S27AE
MEKSKKATKKRKYPVYSEDMSYFKLEAIGGNTNIMIRCTNCGTKWSPDIKSGGKLTRKWWLCSNCGIQDKIVEGKNI